MTVRKKKFWKRKKSNNRTERMVDSVLVGEKYSDLKIEYFDE